jgi:hypothetical protein
MASSSGDQGKPHPEALSGVLESGLEATGTYPADLGAIARIIAFHEILPALSVCEGVCHGRDLQDH